MVLKQYCETNDINTQKKYVMKNTCVWTGFLGSMTPEDIKVKSQPDIVEDQKNNMKSLKFIPNFNRFLYLDN